MKANKSREWAELGQYRPLIAAEFECSQSLILIHVDMQSFIWELEFLYVFLIFAIKTSNRASG